MASKFGILAERLVGAVHYFVPDGSAIGTVELPVTSSKTAKPADPEDWEDYRTGLITTAKYDPKNTDQERRYFSPTLMRHVMRTETRAETDAFTITQIDYPATLFDRLMFGLVSAPVADTPQTVFKTTSRHIDGWSRIVRYDEVDQSVLCEFQIHVRLTITEYPEDKNEKGSPVFRIENLGDAPEELQTIVFNPAA